MLAASREHAYHVCMHDGKLQCARCSRGLVMLVLLGMRHGTHNLRCTVSMSVCRCWPWCSLVPGCACCSEVKRMAHVVTGQTLRLVDAVFDF